MHHIDFSGDGQTRSHQDVVEYLSIPIEIVGIPLRQRQSGGQVDQLAPLEQVEGRGELEVIEVAEDYYAGAGIDGENLLDEAVHHLGLGLALGQRDLARRLDAAE